jgi:hypothetical protein
MTLLKKGHLAQNLTHYCTFMTFHDLYFSGHIELFQRSHEIFVK